MLQSSVKKTPEFLAADVQIKSVHLRLPFPAGETLTGR